MNDNNIETAIRKYLNEKIPDFDSCNKCGICCMRFVYNGPRIYNDEKQNIIGALYDLGSNDISNFVEKNNQLPTYKSESLWRVCTLLDNNHLCMLQKNKPRNCTESPNFIIVKKEIVIMQSDFYLTECRNGMTNAQLKQAVGCLDSKFFHRFGKNLKLVINYPIEKRCQHYYDDE